MSYKLWWLLPDSNWGHKALQASALPTELKSHIWYVLVHVTSKMKCAIGLPLLYYFYNAVSSDEQRATATIHIVSQQRYILQVANDVSYLTVLIVVAF